MVSCKHCMTQNSLDSTFCKKCGTTLPDDEVQQAKEKLEAAVADGFKIFSSGRTDEAMQVAEAAVQANPLSTAALSLKAMCHERMGQIAEALECHERVLDIDPDSMIDRIKVNDLRNLLVARSSIAAVPDRRIAIISSVAAFVLIVSIGVVIARGARSEDKPVAMSTPANKDAAGAHFEQPASTQTTTQAPTGQGASSAPPTQQPPVQTPAKTQGASGSGADNGNTPLPAYSHPDGTGKLPRPDGGAGLDGNIPVRLDVHGVPQQGTAAPQNPPVRNDNIAKDPDPISTDNPPTPPKQEDPGIMQITITGHGAKPASDGDPGSRANGVEALVRAARNQYQLGNYSSAATSYERALRAGADPASGNQRLAQCYEKLGRSAEAVSAYQRAIDALQAELSAGRGDKSRLNAALDSCKQAVKVLGG